MRPAQGNNPKASDSWSGSDTHRRGLDKSSVAVAAQYARGRSHANQIWQARRLEVPNSGSGCGSSSPRLESFFSEEAERAAGCEMPPDVERVLDDGVNGQEALS